STAAVVQHYKPPALLILNVGGAKLRVKRSALTHVKDSKLAWMFSGRWDHVLPRDHSGRIFLDLDVKWFSPITQYLSKLSRGVAADAVHLPITLLSDDDKLGLRACAELYGLGDIFPKATLYSIAEQALVDMAQHVASVARLGQNSGLMIGWSAPWQLLYRSSVHGATAQEFHRLCDGKPNTVCLAVDDRGHVFGGFTSVGWATGTSYQLDPAAFLFCQPDRGDSSVKQRYSPKGFFPQFALYHSDDWPRFGSSDLWFKSAAETLMYSSSSTSFQPMPINGVNDGTVIDLLIWQVPLTDGSAQPVPPPRSDNTILSQEVMTRAATTLNLFSLWLKEQLGACDSELQAIQRRAELFASERAFMQQLNTALPPDDMDTRKNAWLEQVCTSIYVCTRCHLSVSPKACAVYRLRGVHNGIVYIACSGTGQLCTMRDTFTQFGDTPLANKYASDVWGGNVEVELDEEGCVFEDHNQECFDKLVNVMRLRAIVRRTGFSGTIGSSKPAPMPAHLAPTMTNMLEYLMIDSKHFFSSL
ncbi:hypothetical protein JKP88DRAFT_140119, partial [Tribonema minus]